MDPFSLIGGVTSLIGMGMSLGASQKMAEAQQGIATASMSIAKSEQDIEVQKHQEMVLTAKRQQMQTLRNVQLARSMAVSAATNQGAQFGTGLAGGLAQISDQGNNEVLGLNQNVTLANKVFSNNMQISENRMGIAGLQGQVAADQGQMAIGNAIAQAGPTIGKLFGGVGGLFGGSATS